MPSPKNSWSSSSGSKKHKAAIKFKIKSPGAKGGPAAFPIVFPGPPGFKYKGAVVSAAPVVVAASPKAVSAKGAASAPIIVIPSPAAATSLPALRKALADATQMLAVRKAIAVSEALAARTARTNKLPSVDEKRREALAARTNFRDVKALVEKLSARVAAAEATAGVGAAAKGAAAKGVKGAAAVAPSPVAAAPVILNVSPQNQWSSSSDGSRKAKPKLKFSIKPLAKAASPKAASLLGVSPKGNNPNLVNWDTNVLIQQDFPIGSQDWGESPKAVPSASLWGESPKAAPSAFLWGESPKAKASSASMVVVAPSKAKPVQVLAVSDDIAEFMKGQSKAHVVKGMSGQKSRKRSNPLLDLEKQLKEGMKKPKRLERYKRLIAEGRRRDAIQYMRKHNMLHEVMDMSHVVPVEDIDLEVVGIDQHSPSSKKGVPLGLRAQIKEPPVDLNLEVVNINQPSPSSKKRSSSRSRKRASAKPIGSSQSRKVGTGVSFGKMAEALAKQDAAFKPAQFKEPPKAKYVVGVRGAEAGKKGDKTVDALHKKVVNLATSPTFKPYDPKKGKWM